MNDNGTMIITGCTISNNSEGEGQGGGGVMNDNGTMTITGCTIRTIPRIEAALTLLLPTAADMERVGLINYYQLYHQR